MHQYIQINLIAMVIYTGVGVFYFLKLKEMGVFVSDVEKDHIRGITDRQFNSRAGCTETQRLGETKQVCMEDHRAVFGP